MIVLAKQVRYPYRGFVITLKAKNGNIYALWSNGNRLFRRMFRNVKMVERETRPIKNYIEDAIDRMVGPWPQSRAMRNDPQPNPPYRGFTKSWGGYRPQLHENPAKPIYSFGPESFVKPKPKPPTAKPTFPGPQNPGYRPPIKPPFRPPTFRPPTGVGPVKPTKPTPGYRPPIKPPQKPLPYRPPTIPTPVALRINPARGFKVTKVETSGGVTWEWLNDFLSKKDARRLAANTDAIRQSDGSIAVQLYSTKILIFKSNGEIELRLGGWNTATTRNRINALLPYGWKIFTKKGIPYVSNSYKSVEVPPSDKITLTETGAYV